MKNFNLSIDETLIAPSILSADFSRLGEEVALIGLTKSKLLHIDVMDGCFVPNISFGSVVMKSIRNQSDLIFDVHLMINHPLLYIKDFVEAGADIITFHLECEDNTLEVINKIKSYGVKVGISIKPKTKADEVFKYLSLVDMVLVMTVEPGFGGQSFMEAQMPKIKNLKEYINKNNLNIPIEVDGGINDRTVKIAKENGANIFVAGSYIFEKTNYMKAVESLL